jgi:hypothetical protein
VPALEPSGRKPMTGSPPWRVEVRVEILNITDLASRVRARLAFIGLTVGALMLALSPATAGAQQVSESTDAQYNSTLQLLQSGGEPPANPPSSTSDLPFTGLDVMGLFAVGAVLALAGFVLWRRSRTVTGEVGA